MSKKMGKKMGKKKMGKKGKKEIDLKEKSKNLKISNPDDEPIFVAEEEEPIYDPLNGQIVVLYHRHQDSFELKQGEILADVIA